MHTIENPMHTYGSAYGSGTDERQPTCPTCGGETCENLYSDLCAACLHEQICEDLEAAGDGKPVDEIRMREACGWAAEIVEGAGYDLIERKVRGEQAPRAAADDATAKATCHVDPPSCELHRERGSCAPCASAVATVGTRRAEALGLLARLRRIAETATERAALDVISAYVGGAA